MLALERLKEVLAYDHDTGVFTWLVSTSNRVRAGAVAGSVDREGYLRICIDGTEYKAHRLAWFFMTGVWPANQIDHQNCVKCDNRFANLREATNAQNHRNMRLRIDNSSGFKGVRQHGKAWRADIKHDGRRRFLGCFPSAAEAHAAYCRAALALDPVFARAA